MEKIQGIQEYAVNHILAELINEIEDWLVIYNACGEIIYINKHVERLSGYSREEILESKVMPPWQGGKINAGLMEKATMVLDQDRKFDTITLCTKKDGTQFYLAITLSGIRDNKGEIVNYICIGRDITDAKLLHERLHRMKYVDEITNLPNQTAFIELVYNKINREKDKRFAVILIDINKMSYINNVYGLTTGDIVIKEIGQRIRNVVNTQSTIAKLNSDVFAVLEECRDEDNTLRETLTEIFEQMKDPIKVQSQEIYIEMRAGVGVFPDDAHTAGALINKVQIALARAKELAGKSQFIFYEEHLQNEVQERMLLESDMHQAFRNKEFIVYYQPFIDLKRHTLTGMEALLRRKKSSGEIILPGKFINLLEQMELIEQVGVQVIEEVCKQLREWIDEGYNVVPISINLSTLQFKNVKLAKDIIRILERYNIPPTLIVLEITESVVMQEAEVAQKIIQELRKKGFKIAIDDFGTGYSSLGYLKKFLFDHLKIDISFIREIADNPQDRAIVGGIISIAKALELQTIAEGIETDEQLEIIKEMGCEMGQGYLWDAPMKKEEIQSKYLIKLYK